MRHEDTCQCLWLVWARGEGLRIFRAEENRCQASFEHCARSWEDRDRLLGAGTAREGSQSSSPGKTCVPFLSFPDLLLNDKPQDIIPSFEMTSGPYWENQLSMRTAEASLKSRPSKTEFLSTSHH